jgi:hypothetical protein
MRQTVSKSQFKANRSGIRMRRTPRCSLRFLVASFALEAPVADSAPKGTAKQLRKEYVTYDWQMRSVCPIVLDQDEPWSSFSSTFHGCQSCPSQFWWPLQYSLTIVCTAFSKGLCRYLVAKGSTFRLCPNRSFPTCRYISRHCGTVMRSRASITDMRPPVLVPYI